MLPMLFALALQAAEPIPDPRIACIYDALSRDDARAALGLAADGSRMTPSPAAERKLRIAGQNCQNYYNWFDHLRWRAAYYFSARTTREAMGEALVARGLSAAAIDQLLAELSPVERRQLFIAANGPAPQDLTAIRKVARLAEARVGRAAATLLATGVVAAAGMTVAQDSDIGPILVAAGRSRNGLPRTM